MIPENDMIRRITRRRYNLKLMLLGIKSNLFIVL